jgi:hypothetical protein
MSSRTLIEQFVGKPAVLTLRDGDVDAAGKIVGADTTGVLLFKTTAAATDVKGTLFYPWTNIRNIHLSEQELAVTAVTEAAA